ncbi:Hypothetical protein CAP_4112 [Chondromyces apiculatus DSM 436]|uniref:Uncharacterized protein n=1 Tax=Chondromyces apiculatus DSM 436 TaxID=1192034 RepID=A0A017TI87_9BACT|nr:Hypothetical protein CAP_4112 [Chondromyces apiculatus DSM 436]
MVDSPLQRVNALLAEVRGGDLLEAQGRFRECPELACRRDAVRFRLDKTFGCERCKLPAEQAPYRNSERKSPVFSWKNENARRASVAALRGRDVCCAGKTPVRCVSAASTSESAAIEAMARASCIVHRASSRRTPSRAGLASSGAPLASERT